MNPNIFAVVGAHREDPDVLLLQDEHGHHYTLPTPGADPVPVEPDDANDWDIDQETITEDLWL